MLFLISYDQIELNFYFWGV